MRARFQNSYHEQLMTIKCSIKDHPQLKYSFRITLSLSKFDIHSPFSKTDNVYQSQKLIHLSYIEQDISFKNHCQELALKETFILFILIQQDWKNTTSKRKVNFTGLRQENKNKKRKE